MKPTTYYCLTISDCKLPEVENINSVRIIKEEVIKTKAKPITTENQEVYDITVDSKEHNFIANGIPVSNSRSPERRLFYIDVGQLPPYKVEAFMERIKDQFRKKKVITNRGYGPSGVEEKYHQPAIDEDYWVPIRPNSNTRIETLPGACLSLSTKIPLLDGRILTLQEIINEFEQGKINWTYSCHPETGETAPGKIDWAGITRRNTKVVKVHFDNGHSVICTPDHKFPVQTKGFVEAKDLQPDDSMFPFKTRLKEFIRMGNEYLQVYDNELRKWIFVHRRVAEKATNYAREFIYNEKYKDEEKNEVHHLDYDKFNNNPTNLSWISKADHSSYHRTESEDKELVDKKISESHKERFANLSEEEKQKIREKLRIKADNGRKVTIRKLQEDPEFREMFIKNQKEGWEEFRTTEAYKERGKKITEKNNKYWSDPENKKKVFAKQTVAYPKKMFDKFMSLLDVGINALDTIAIINADKEIIAEFIEANKHIKRKVDFSKGIDVQHLSKMVKTYGYKNIKHAKKEAGNYNCKVVKVEYLSECIDTGTLTIDQNHEIHNYHTFPIVFSIGDNRDIEGIFTKNSNLAEIDDVVYFRNKLFVSMNFPKNYFAAEDPNATRITLSAQDVKFARMIERLQSPMENGLYDIADRHLTLRGFPKESYHDLKLPFTPPSDWRELSRAEVTTNRINNANALKGSQLMADFDILTKWMKYTEEEANEMISRMKLQKMEDLKLQVLAQNPQLLGVGLPSQGNEPEMGAEPGGPNPNLNPQAPPEQGMLPPTPETPPQVSPDMTGQPPMPPTEQAKPLPDPSQEDIIKYDLEIEDFEKAQDEEDIDYSELP